MAEFSLECRACGQLYNGAAGLRLRCDGELDGRHGPALLRPSYARKQIEFRPDLPGIFSYADWLPTGRTILNSAPEDLGVPYTYRSTGLAERLGLKNLHIAFSGYWPERRANLVTRTFKEFEVQASIAFFLQALRGRETPPLVIASAGNTANSFNHYTHALGLPLYLFVPESGLNNLLLPFDTNPILIAVDGDYSDAISLADQVADRAGMLRDGGVFNPGRRGGMAVAMLNAVVHPRQGSGRMYHHYFQAVGSGSGAIAAWEAVEMLREDGRFGNETTRIHMAQNAPFTPLHDAWQANSSTLMALEEKEARMRIGAVSAMVLTNRRPPYAIAGGVRDVLATSGGTTWQVTNEQVFHAARMFRALEGVDIGPAGSVALGALCQAVEAGAINPSEQILLHITGGGRAIQYSEGRIRTPEPLLRTSVGEVERVLEAIGPVKPVEPALVDQALKTYELADAV